MTTETLAAAVAPVQNASLDELKGAIGTIFSVLSFGASSVEANHKRTTTIQLLDIVGAHQAKVELLRITTKTGATLALKSAGKGTVLSGTGTNDMIVETDGPTGQFDLEVTDSSAETITVAVGTTQSSGFVDCRATIDLAFAG